jgi:hypothetical protein
MNEKERKVAEVVEQYIPEFIDLEMEVVDVDNMQKYEVDLSTRVNGERYAGSITVDHPNVINNDRYLDMKSREIEELLKEFVRAGVQELAA